MGIPNLLPRSILLVIKVTTTDLMASLRALFVLALVLVAVVATESASSPASTPSAAPDTNNQNPLLAPKPNTPLPDSGAESPDGDAMDDDDAAPAGSPHAATANNAPEGTSNADSGDGGPTSSDDSSASAIGVTSMAAVAAVAASYIVF